MLVGPPFRSPPGLLVFGSHTRFANPEKATRAEAAIIATVCASNFRASQEKGKSIFYFLFYSRIHEMAAALVLSLLGSLLGKRSFSGHQGTVNESPDLTDAISVRKAIYRQLVPAAPGVDADADAAGFAANLTRNGTWPDINYADGSRSWWFAAEHLRRTLLLATVSASSGSTVDRAKVGGAADRALIWWLASDPQNSNWWWMQIGIPRIIAKCLIARPDGTRLAQATRLLDRTPLFACAATDGGERCTCVASPHACHYMNDGLWTGCNRVWSASFHVLLGAIELNVTHLSAAFDSAHSAVAVTAPTAEGGIQADGSFHQHGPQLYMGWGYGAIFTTNVLALEAYAAETAWAMPAARWELMARFVLDGQALATRGANFDFLACGRLFTYFVNVDRTGVNAGHYHYFAAFTPFELAFPTFAAPFTTPIGVFFAPLLDRVDPARPRATEMAAFARRLAGVDGDVKRHRHFPDSDYTAFHQPEYAVFVHMLSTRTASTECVNDENKKGRMVFCFWWICCYGCTARTCASFALGVTGTPAATDRCCATREAASNIGSIQTPCLMV